MAPPAAPPVATQKQFDHGTQPINPFARVANKATSPKDLTAYGQFHYPFNSQIDLECNFQIRLDCKNKVVEFNASWSPSLLQDIPTPQKVLLQALHVTKSLPTCNLTLYGSASTNGQTYLGVRTKGVREADNSTKEKNYHNTNNEIKTNRHVISPQSLNSMDDSSVDTYIDPQSLKATDISGLNQKSSLDLIESEKVVAIQNLLKDVSPELVAQSLYNALIVTAQKKQVAYFIVGMVFITIRVGTLRVRKTYRTKNKNMAQDEFIKKTRIITFVIDRSTDLSTIAISIVCFPFASSLILTIYNLFLLFLKYLNLPNNFFIMVFCFLDDRFLLSAFCDVIKIAFNLGISGFFRIVLINLLEILINIFLEKVCVWFAKVCVWFASRSSSSYKSTEANA